MTRFLLDTCAISDARKPISNRGLIDWLGQFDAGVLHLSVVTIGEVRWGIESLPEGKKRDTLDRWLREDIVAAFGRRVLTVDLPIVQTWGLIRAKAKRVGNAAAPIDTLLAATAIYHDLVLVTRNERDFAGTGASVVNPWSAR